MSGEPRRRTWSLGSKKIIYQAIAGFEAFRRQFEGEGFYGIRLLVARDDEGEVSADCRVNGIDWEIGKEHLIKYGETWADRGIEMRKQYVAIYILDAK